MSEQRKSLLAVRLVMSFGKYDMVAEGQGARSQRVRDLGVAASIMDREVVGVCAEAVSEPVIDLLRWPPSRGQVQRSCSNLGLTGLIDFTQGLFEGLSGSRVSECPALYRMRALFAR